MTTGLPQDARNDVLELIISAAMARDGYQAANFLPVAKFGENMSIDTTTTPEDVWSGGGLYPFPAAAAETTLVSSSTDDDTGGTGAIEVYIDGLTTGFVQANELIALDGTTPVTCANQYLRINRMYVGECGTALSNVGTIQAKHGSTVISEIQADHGQTTQAVYTVPLGYAGYVHTLNIGVTDDQASQFADCHLQKRSNLEPITGWRVIRDNIVLREAPYSATITAGGSTVQAGDDILVRVDAVSSNGIRVYAEFDLHLFKTD